MLSYFFVIPLLAPAFAEKAVEFPCLNTTTCRCRNDTSLTMSVNCCVDGEPLRHRLILPNNTSAVKLDNCALTSDTLPTFSHLPYLTNVSLVKNNLNRLSKNLFYNLSSLRFVDFSLNVLTQVSSNAFSLVPRLDRLIFYNNKELSLSEIKPVITLFPPGQKISLDFSEGNRGWATATQVLESSYIEHLNKLSVQALTLDAENIQRIDPKTLKYLNTTKCISIAYNFVSRISPSDIVGYFVGLHYLKSLIVLRISSQNMPSNYFQSPLTSFEEICKSAEKDTENLQCSDGIKDLPENGIFVNFYTKLQRLYIDNWTLGYFGFTNMTFSTNTLTHLYMRNANVLAFRGSIFNLTCLKHLDVSNTPIVLLSTKVLAYIPNLEYLNMSRCSLGSQLEKPDMLALNNTNRLATIDLSHNNLTRVHMSDLEKYASSVKHVYLQHNQLKTIPQLKLNNLQILDFSFNRIVVSDPRNVEAIKFFLNNSNKTLQINLKGNEMFCSCNEEGRKFIEWFQSVRSRFSDVESYTCVSDVVIGGKQKQIVGINLTSYWFSCHFVPFFTLIIIVLLILGVVLVIALTSKYNLALKYRLNRLKEFIFKTRHFKSSEATEQRLPLLQPSAVYLVFAEPDLERCKQIAQAIINADSSCNIIYHNKSFSPSRYILDNIFEAMDESTFAIVILSQHTFEDETVAFALGAMGAKEPGYVISVGVPPLPKEHVRNHSSHFVRHLLDNVIKSAGQELFEDEVLEAILGKLNI